MIAEKVPAWLGDRTLPVSCSIAEYWEVLDAERQLAGRPLNLADGLIAAAALEHNLILITRNVKDFAGLSVQIVSPWAGSLIQGDLMPGYTQPSNVAMLVPKELAAELRRTVDAGFESLCRLPEPLTSQPLKPGKWSPKQVVGHLIDSAANNHQRFVRLQIDPELRMEGYRQEEWVSVQCYAVMPWMQVLETWRVFNTHLAYVVQHVKPESLGNVWHYADGQLTLGYLIEDYIAHMRHHLRQLPSFEV